MKTELEFILAGSDVKRYHTVMTLQNETVGHHSHGVACLIMLLNPRATRKLLMAALMHDLSEHQTGDIPSPAKRAYRIGQQVEKLEIKLMEEAGFVFPNLAPGEARTLKIADIAHGALFCAREINLGNTGMKKVFNRYLSYAKHMNLVGREQKLFDLIKEMVDGCE